MKTNLIEKIYHEFNHMSFIEKSMFLKDYKQTVELLPNQIKNHIEYNLKGFRKKLIEDLVAVIPPKYQLDTRTYYNKIANKNTYEVFDLYMIVALGKVLDHKELIEKTYKLIVFTQKDILWRDCAKLGIQKNHFKEYWHWHPQKKSFFRLVRLNESWPHLIDFICDIYGFYNYVINYRDSFLETYKQLAETDENKHEDYVLPGIKLDPYVFKIDIV